MFFSATELANFKAAHVVKVFATHAVLVTAPQIHLSSQNDEEIVPFKMFRSNAALDEVIPHARPCS